MINIATDGILGGGEITVYTRMVYPLKIKIKTKRKIVSIIKKALKIKIGVNKL